MKTFLIALLLFSLAACSGGADKPQQINIPADSDLKADVMLRGAGPSRKIEISFYISKPVAPGEKTAPPLQVVPMEEVRFNDTPLTQGSSDTGRAIYFAENLPVKTENLVTAKLNGKQFEGRAQTQTTVPDRSASIVMTPK